MDENYWKDAYQDTWDETSKREKGLKAYIEKSVGVRCSETGLGTGTTVYISGTAEKNGYQKGDADIVYIDYLNLIRPEGKELLSELKAIAIKFDIPIIGMEQIPRGSGEVKMDSPYIDNLFCLTREGNNAWLVDLKNNNKIELSFDSEPTGSSVI